MHGINQNLAVGHLFLQKMNKLKAVYFRKFQIDNAEIETFGGYCWQQILHAGYAFA